MISFLIPNSSVRYELEMSLTMTLQLTRTIFCLVSLFITGSSSLRLYRYRYYGSYSRYYFYTGGTIAGIVIGCVICIGVVIALIVGCCVQASRPSGRSTGAVVRRGQPSIAVTNASVSAGYPHYPMMPPPPSYSAYPGYPSVNPGYPPPRQPVFHPPNVPTAKPTLSH